MSLAAYVFGCVAFLSILTTAICVEMSKASTQFRAEIVEYKPDAIRIHRPGFKPSQHDLVVVLRLIAPKKVKGMLLEVGITRHLDIWRKAEGHISFTADMEMIRSASKSESETKLFDGSLRDVRFETSGGFLENGD